MAILSHILPFLGLFFNPFWPFRWGGNGSKWVRTPYSWGKMGRGVKIGGFRGPKWRLDPILGSFLAIFGHFWLALLGPFLALFGHLDGDNDSEWVRTPCRWGKMGRESKMVGPEGPSGV